MIRRTGSTPAPREGIRSFLLSLGVLVGALIPLGCGDAELAYGDANSIVVASTPELWNAVGDSLQRALEPSITTTVETEEIFTATHHDPQDSSWVNLRKFRQLLLVGSADRPWIRPALEAADDPIPTPPAVLRAFDVWARNQTATVLLLPDGEPPDAVLGELAMLRDDYLERYRRLAVARMFVSGRDSALSDTLRATARFGLLLPEVYRWRQEDGVYLFRNDNPDPSELIRQFAVTWRSPVPEEMPDSTELLAWRSEVEDAHYTEPQDIDLSLARAGPFEYRGHEAYELRAVWVNTPEADWPAAGPFVLRAVACRNQDRLYLLDAWLYAPGKDKFEYMVQLETILDSFRCGS